MTLTYDPSVNRYRDSQGRFATTEEVKQFLEGLADRPCHSSFDPAILAELKKLNAKISDLHQEAKQSNRHQQTIQHYVRETVGSFCTLRYGIAIAATLGIVVYQSFFNPNQPNGTLAIGAMSDSEFSRPLKEGDQVDRFTVTSGFGMRNHPISGTERQHNGVDLDAPEGTQLHMIGDKGTVECLEDPGGWGTYAIIRPQLGGTQAIPFRFTPSQAPLGYEFLAGHLSNCRSGEYLEGQIFARTGNTGGSTGPHLHWEQHLDGKAVQPTNGYLYWAVSGRKPSTPIAAANSAFGGVTDRITRAIADQESGGNCSQANRSGSGAAGCYQIMPENLPQWSKEALGREITMDQFMADPALQHQIAGFKLNQYWEEELQKAGGNEAIAARRVAARWYSGDGNLYTSTTPQYWNGNQYPSIAEYADSVAQKAGF